MVKNEKINSVHYNVMMNDSSYYIMYLLARPLMVLHNSNIFNLIGICFYDIKSNYESYYTYQVITTQQE